MAPVTSGRDIDRGWAWVVMAATYVGLVMFSTSYFTIGVVYVELLNHYHEDKVKTSLVGTLNTALYALLAPFASAFACRFSCRRSVLIGGLLLGTSGLLSSFANSVDMLILTHGVLGGIGNTLVGIPLKVILGYYFEKRRHFVISLAASVFGTGMFLATPMALAIFKEFGIKGGFMMLGAFNLNMCVIGMICRPSSIELKILQQRAAANNTLLQTEISSSKNKIEDSNGVLTVIKNSILKLNNLFHVEMFSDFRFTLFLFSTFTWNFMLAICQMHLPNYMLIQGSGAGDVTFIMTLFGASNTVGRFLGAFSVNNSRINSLVLHVILIGISGVLVLVFPFYGHLKGANVFFAISIGLLTGGPNGFMASIALDILGLQKLAAAHGLEYLFCGLGFGGGPPIASALYSNSGSYTSSFIVAGTTVIVGGVLGLIAHIRSPKNVPTTEVMAELTIDNNGRKRNDVYNGINGTDVDTVDPLLTSNGTKTGAHAKLNGLHPDITDILALAGSANSLTI